MTEVLQNVCPPGGSTVSATVLLRLGLEIFNTRWTAHAHMPPLTLCVGHIYRERVHVQADRHCCRRSPIPGCEGAAA